MANSRKLKILIIGESGVGKSSLLHQYVFDSFEDDSLPATINMDIKPKVIQIDGEQIKLEIYDTAGQEIFRSLPPSYYRNAHGAILMYDVNKRQTFQKLESWLEELHIYCEDENLVKMVIGNKIDIVDRQVDRDTGIKFAKKNRTSFFETSAKTNEFVKEAFEELTRKIMEKQEFEYGSGNIKLNNDCDSDGVEEAKWCQC